MRQLAVQVQPAAAVVLADLVSDSALGAGELGEGALKHQLPDEQPIRYPRHPAIALPRHSATPTPNTQHPTSHAPPPTHPPLAFSSALCVHHVVPKLLSSVGCLPIGYTSNTPSAPNDVTESVAKRGDSNVPNGSNSGGDSGEGTDGGAGGGGESGTSAISKAPYVHTPEPELTLYKRFSVRTLVRICDAVGGDLSRDTALLVVRSLLGSDTAHSSEARKYKSSAANTDAGGSSDDEGGGRAEEDKRMEKGALGLLVPLLALPVKPSIEVYVRPTSAHTTPRHSMPCHVTSHHTVLHYAALHRITSHRAPPQPTPSRAHPPTPPPP